MPRQSLKKEVHSADLPIEQQRDIKNSPDQERDEGDIILVDPAVATKAYQDELAFMEEPVTIRIEPGSEEHAPMAVMLACNGKGCEVLIKGRWREYPGGWVPVGEVLTIKRKYLEILARSKITKIETVLPEPGSEEDKSGSGGRVKRITRQSNSFSVLKDESPRGNAWLTEIMRRNM